MRTPYSIELLIKELDGHLSKGNLIESYKTLRDLENNIQAHFRDRTLYGK